VPLMSNPIIAMALQNNFCPNDTSERVGADGNALGSSVAGAQLPQPSES